MLGKLLKSDSQHDLDISCYIYDQDKQFIDFVGAEAQDSMDETEKIYHSGDDMSGSGDGDDERISIELAEMPIHVRGIVILIEVRSNHTFSDVLTPYVRLADGMTNDNLLEIDLVHDEAGDKNAFVMCSIYRDIDNSPTGWGLHHIAAYPDISKIEDWGAYLARYVH
jgi:stress response protein SCP2